MRPNDTRDDEYPPRWRLDEQGTPLPMENFQIEDGKDGKDDGDETETQKDHLPLYLVIGAAVATTLAIVFFGLFITCSSGIKMDELKRVLSKHEVSKEDIVTQCRHAGQTLELFLPGGVPPEHYKKWLETPPAVISKEDLSKTWEDWGISFEKNTAASDTYTCLVWNPKDTTCLASTKAKLEVSDANMAGLLALHHEVAGKDATALGNIQRTDKSGIGELEEPYQKLNQILAFGNAEAISFLSPDAVMPFYFKFGKDFFDKMGKAGASAVALVKLQKVKFDMQVRAFNALKALLFDPLMYESFINVQDVTDFRNGDRLKLRANNGDATAVKEMGRRIKNLRDDIWLPLQWDIAVALATAKFKDYADSADSADSATKECNHGPLLRATGDRILVEALGRVPKEGTLRSRWGISLSPADADVQNMKKWPGAPYVNMQGFALMAVRQKLQEQEDNNAKPNAEPSKQKTA